MSDPIVPPATIGMLGGGQLGRYTLMAARVMGYRTMVLDPDPAAPAGRIADRRRIGPVDEANAWDIPDRLVTEAAFLAEHGTDLETLKAMGCTVELMFGVLSW